MTGPCSAAEAVDQLRMVLDLSPLAGPELVVSKVRALLDDRDDLACKVGLYEAEFWPSSAGGEGRR